MDKVSIIQVRSEIGRYQNFSLQSISPMDSLMISGHYDRIAVSITAVPYIALKNDYCETHLNHIESISREKNGIICAYIFTCDDYTVGGLQPCKKQYRLECC